LVNQDIRNGWSVTNITTKRNKNKTQDLIILGFFIIMRL